MKRRRFLAIAISGGVAATAAYATWNSFEKVVAKILQNDLSELRIPGEMVDRFLGDARKNYLWDQFSTSKKLLIRFHFLFGSSLIKLPYYHKYVHYKNIIVGEFLFATNYFQNQHNVNFEIKYTGIFNPYERFCSNPFSSILNT